MCSLNGSVPPEMKGYLHPAMMMMMMMMTIQTFIHGTLSPIVISRLIVYISADTAEALRDKTDYLE